MKPFYLIPIEKIEPNPWQPRTSYDPAKIQELADSITAHSVSRSETLGLLQVPAGRRSLNGRLATKETFLWREDVLEWLEFCPDARIQLAYGHRRLEAFKLKNIHVMPVALGEFSDEEMATMAWTENSARDDLNPMEKARGIQRMISSFKWTQEQAAGKLQLDRSTVANKIRLLKLPEEVQKAVCEGKVSERQAMTLLPVLELPKETLELAEKKQYDWEKPSAVIQEVLQGKSSSDELRAHAQRAISAATVEFGNGKHPFLEEEIMGDRVLSPICKGCAFKKQDPPRCFRPDCFKIKQILWEAREATRVVEATGLQLLPSNTSSDTWDVLDGWSAADKEAVKKVLEKGCPNLRIIAYRYGGFRPEGFENYAYACEHGKGHKCTCMNAAKREVKKEDPQEIARKVGEKEVGAALDKAIMSLVIALENMTPEAWLAVWRRFTYGEEERKLKPDAPIEKILRAFAMSTLENKLSWSAKSDPAQARKELGDLLLQAEATVPWLETGETKADKAWGKFLRIRDWMKELIQEFPSGEAVRGNIDNLDKIWNERGAMETVKAMEIIRAQQLLNKLLPIVEGWTADDPFRVVSGLVTVPVGDANFDIHQATLRVIRYALLFIPEDGNKTRIGRLQARLARLESEEEETGEILAEEK